MARTVRDARLDTRAARGRLPPSHKPYWRVIDQGCHIGYRKGARGGSWRARFFAGKGRYLEAGFGKADDMQDADGVGVLSFSQAQEAAREWFSKQYRVAAGMPITRGGRYTVADVMDEYLTWYKLHRRGFGNVRAAVKGHIEPEFGSTPVEKLSHVRIRAFHEDLASKPARMRTRKGQPQRYRPDPSTPDEVRARRASANRVLNILKAALNRAYTEGRITSDDAWRRVKPFREVDMARVRYLKEKEVKELIKVCAPNFRNLVQAAILTGCRYGELTAMQIKDYNPDSGTILIAASKSGKARHVTLSKEGKNLFGRLSKQRDRDAHIFVQANGLAWKKSYQFRPLREACLAAKINPPISFHILRHTHASYLAMRNTPLAVIASQLGHADTRMTEKHYAHLASSYISDTIRAKFPKLGLGGRAKAGS